MLFAICMLWCCCCCCCCCMMWGGGGEPICIICCCCCCCCCCCWAPGDSIWWRIWWEGGAVEWGGRCMCEWWTAPIGLYKELKKMLKIKLKKIWIATYKNFYIKIKCTSAFYYLCRFLNIYNHHHRNFSHIEHYDTWVILQSLINIGLPCIIFLTFFTQKLICPRTSDPFARKIIF